MKSPKVAFYLTANKQWRWRLVAANGRAICNPGEQFTRKRDAVRNYETVRDALFAGPVVE